MFRSKAGLVLDGENIRLTSTAREHLNVGIFPAPPAVAFNGESLRPKGDGIFQLFTPEKPKAISLKATLESVQSAGSPCKISPGKIKEAVAAAPEDGLCAGCGLARQAVGQNGPRRGSAPAPQLYW